MATAADGDPSTEPPTSAEKSSPHRSLTPDGADLGGGEMEDKYDEVGAAGNDDADDEEEEEEEEEEELEGPEAAVTEMERMKQLHRQLSSGVVRLRVHDVLIKGNSRTRDSVIEAEVLPLFRSASTMQEIIGSAKLAADLLRRLDVFDAVSITLDAGPPELPGTTNIVIEVVEAASPLTGNFGVFSKPEARSWSLEGSLKLRNPFGHADIWDASGSYGLDQTTEVSVGVSLPRFKAIATPLTARIALLTQDWSKPSSYSQRLLGFSSCLLSTNHHEISYDLAWRTLTDPSRMSSGPVRRQLGHGLLSKLTYKLRYDQRNSVVRPTRGYAFQSCSQIAGLWGSNSQRFFRQEFDLRAALPLGFFNSAFNFGVCLGAIIPLGIGFYELPSPLPDRFYLGGYNSPVCSLGGSSSMLGFRTRGLGPTERRRFIPAKHDAGNSTDPGRDSLGGDLAVTAFADLSFNLPLKLFRDAGIHGHTFITAGNLAKLSEGEFRRFSVPDFLHSFRSSCGVGIILPTRFFRVEINYCYILKQLEHDNAKTGIQFSFSSP